MITVSRRVTAAPEAVFGVLADGWSYAGWVVGASRIRAVDPEWPAAGSRIHHSVGAWPLLVDDTTEVMRVEPGRELRLRARAWPAGEAEVRFLLAPDGAGATEVTLQEDAVRGPGTLLPTPLRRLVLVPRNVETLRRLAFRAEAS